MRPGQWERIGQLLEDMDAGVGLIPNVLNTARQIWGFSDLTGRTPGVRND